MDIGWVIAISVVGGLSIATAIITFHTANTVMKLADIVKRIADLYIKENSLMVKKRVKPAPLAPRVKALEDIVVDLGHALEKAAIVFTNHEQRISKLETENEANPAHGNGSGLILPH